METPFCDLSFSKTLCASNGREALMGENHL